MNDRLEYRRSLGLPKDIPAEEWACAGCGASGPDRFRRCDCPTNVVVMQCDDGRTFTAWKADANQERKIQAAFDGCDECTRVKAALKEIGAWCADVLNSDRGAASYELREFANDVHSRIHEASHPIMNVLSGNSER